MVSRWDLFGILRSVGLDRAVSVFDSFLNETWVKSRFFLAEYKQITNLLIRLTYDPTLVYIWVLYEFLHFYLYLGFCIRIIVLSKRSPLNIYHQNEKWIEHRLYPEDFGEVCLFFKKKSLWYWLGMHKKIRPKRSGPNWKSLNREKDRVGLAWPDRAKNAQIWVKI